MYRTANKYLAASVPWFHVFKRNFLITNNLFFTPNLLNEDDELRMRLFFFAKEVRYIPFAHYVYSAMRPGSLTTVNHTFTMKSAESSIKTIDGWKGFEKENAKTQEQRQYVNAFIKSKYQSLVLLAARKDDKELYHLYQEHKNEWRKGYRKSFKKTISFKNISIIDYIKYLIALYCPQYFKYTNPKTLKQLLKGK